MDKKELLAELENLKTQLLGSLSDKQKTEIEAQIKALNIEGNTKAIEEVRESLKGLASAKDVETIKGLLDKTIEEVEKLVSDAKVKPLNGGNSEKTKTFNESLAETIENFADQIKGFKKGAPELKMEMKTVGDMSISGNFSTATSWIQQPQSRLIESPYNRVWLADVLPGATSDGNSIIYPKENGGEGAAALWTDRTADKAQIDYDFTTQSAFFKWIAGFVIVDREMLDDIAWLKNYLQMKMLISLKTAENDFILNGSADTNPVTGLLDAATAYNGTYDTMVERVIDAAYGQIVEDTNGFYNPTHVVMRPRKAVAIGLNKAAGSNEFDLPNGSAAFASGKLDLAGLSTVTTTAIAATDFLTFDRNATAYITRMQPEIRMFEDATLAKKNRVMFRVEKRATLAIFNSSAIVSGALVAE